MNACYLIGYLIGLSYSLASNLAITILSIFNLCNENTTL